jgi:hypothetical protein
MLLLLWLLTDSNHSRFKDYKIYVVFWLSTQQIYHELNQSNITVLHWFHLVTATCFDPLVGSSSVSILKYVHHSSLNPKIDPY